MTAPDPLSDSPVAGLPDALVYATREGVRAGVGVVVLVRDRGGVLRAMPVRSHDVVLRGIALDSPDFLAELEADDQRAAVLRHFIGMDNGAGSYRLGQEWTDALAADLAHDADRRVPVFRVDGQGRRVVDERRIADLRDAGATQTEVRARVLEQTAGRPRFVDAAGTVYEGDDALEALGLVGS